MVEFSFYLSEEDADRVFAIKELQGKDELTANQFAKKLLEDELFRLFPECPERDDAGNLKNVGCYQGKE